MQDNDTKARALANAQRAEDGKKAMADYEAQAIALRARTERLRALRLAKEAAEGKTPPKRAAAPRKKAAVKKESKAVASSATLAQWLNDQEKSGRRT